MSSPLSMLKKTRRTPLQGLYRDQWGRESVPFRRNLLKEFQAPVVDSDDTDHSKPHQRRHTPSSNAPHRSSRAPVKIASPPSDFELMSAMMQRVTLLEQKVMSQVQELEVKNKKITDLEEQMRVQTISGDRGDLERRCQQLQNQVEEMERFLNDYGLIWVGDEKTSDSAECEQTHRSGPAEVGDFHLDYNLVLQRIKELNVLAGEGETFVRSTARGAQLAKKDPIRLRLYSNGIVLFDGPFRSYEEQSTQQFMQDLMDGYFPSELQERFPDGIPFEVHDRRDEEFIFRLPWDKFPGEGQAICGKRNKSSNVTSSQTPGKKLTMNQMLNSMPKMVVKAGRVIDIRDSLRATLQGLADAQSSDSVILIDTTALQAMKERLQTPGSERPPSARDIITLKVKSEDGHQTYILKMCLSETIGHLRQYLDTHRGSGLPGYDIISTYPKRCYEDNSTTLQSCGLLGNATLLLRRRQHVHSQTEVPESNS